MTDSPAFPRDVGVIGGAGHVGLPLSLVLCDAGLRTVIYDIDRPRVDRVRNREMPFLEEGGEELLRRCLESGRLEVRSDPGLLGECRFLVLVVGTPVDEHLNPSFGAIQRTLAGCRKHLRDGQILILRSTVFPGTSKHIQDYARELDLDLKVSFCPERVAQGYAIEEIRTLPQIVSAFDEETLSEVRSLFSRFTPECIEMEPMEAELTKLITNAWRYLQFAIVNQFYMIASENDLDFGRILHACQHHYPRMAGLPGPGFAAGPCLLKDTMQLGAFSRDSFVLGHAAMLVNEGLPNHLIRIAKQRKDLSGLTAGILGMAFKAESDDGRDSLSYKLKKLLGLEVRRVLCSDPYVQDPRLSPLEVVLDESDILFIGAPHKIYRELRIPPEKVLVDVWGCVDTGTGRQP